MKGFAGLAQSLRGARRLGATVAIVATASIASLGSAQPAHAVGAGTFDFAGPNGICLRTLQGTLMMKSPQLYVYGLSSTQTWARVFYRVADLNGNSQTEWGNPQTASGDGWVRASSSSPAVVGAVDITRGVLKAYSQIEFFVQYYNTNDVYTWYFRKTLQSYATYSYGGAMPGLKFDGMSSACFG